jgi:maltose alpha-D-glucosyltransferase/alpha-amylase
MSDSTDSPWYINAVFYELYVRAFRDSNGDGHGDIPGVIEKLDYLQELGVDCVWLLPTFPSPLIDDGYDIADYYGVHPDYGTIDDMKQLIQEVHNRGMRIIIDLVVNHTSDQHPWFQEARQSKDSAKRNWYVWSDTKDKYSEARIIFLDTEESNWAWDEQSQQYYWHRFYSEQPDLNYDNPDVQQAMMDVMHYWLEMGIDGFRVDAVPYLFEREGTNCENLPETHAYLRKMRRYIDEHFPEAVMLAEANQLPHEVIQYFAQGDEFHMGFHFPLMPRIFMALKKEEGSDIRDIMVRTPPIPQNTQWCTFLRNHDELTLEMVTEGERQWMWEQYAPEERMRLNLGIRRRLMPLLDSDDRKVMLAKRILFSLPGAPIIYYGDEIGMGDDIDLSDRDGVRTPMQWDDGPNAGFSEAEPEELFAPVIDDTQYGYGYKERNVRAQFHNPDSLFNKMRELINLRKEYSVFAQGSIYFYETGNPSILAFQRVSGDQIMIVLHNLSGEEQSCALDLTEHEGRSITDLLSPIDGYPKIRYDPAYRFDMEPYHSKFLLLSPSELVLSSDLIQRIRAIASQRGITVDQAVSDMLSDYETKLRRERIEEQAQTE